MFNPNGYDIKGVKYLPTHDGVAFTGTLYKDGKRIGSVENGRPELTVPFDEETAIECLLQIDDARREARAFDRRAKTAIVYREHGDRSDQYRSAKFKAPLTPATALAEYRAPWWQKVKDVWYIGQGWRPEGATAECRVDRRQSPIRRWTHAAWDAPIFRLVFGFL